MRPRSDHSIWSLESGRCPAIESCCGVRRGVVRKVKSSESFRKPDEGCCQSGIEMHNQEEDSGKHSPRPSLMPSKIPGERVLLFALKPCGRPEDGVVQTRNLECHYGVE